MDINKSVLYLFTSVFPYGNKSETFIETEIKYLCEEFEQVVVFPSHKVQYCRTIPQNASINNCLNNLNFSKKKKIIALISSFLITINIVFSEVLDKGLFKVLKNLKPLLDYLSTELTKAKSLEKQFASINIKNAIFYDYWFVDSTLALSILKHKKKIQSFISRGHGFDIYDERMGTLGVPFRKWKLKKIKSIYIISEYGLKYFKNKVSTNYHYKLKLSRLGVEKQQQNLLQSNINPETKIIVSCSSMLSFKNVEQMPLLLKNLTENIHWIHFGDGPNKEIIENACSYLPNNVTYTLMGHVDNSKIIEHYKNSNVDLFISLSQSEGLPVSMMEAQSFGIPIIAIPIGGIPEIVINGVTGFLLKENDIDYNLSILKKAIFEYDFDKYKILDFFNSNFLASKNYTNFVKEICL